MTGGEATEAEGCVGVCSQLASLLTKVHTPQIKDELGVRRERGYREVPRTRNPLMGMSYSCHAEKAIHLSGLGL